MHIIGKVSQSDFDIGSDYSNCPYYQSLGSLSLYSENMFYSRSNFRPRVISLLLPIVQLLVLTSLTLKMFTKSQSLKFFQTFFRSICRICKDIFAGVILVKYFFKYIAVMNGRWSNFVLANKFVLNVYFYMVFAAKVILSIFLNPISISIFMTAFFLTPIFWNFPVLYLPVFLSAITLFWSCCDRSINNLTFLSLKSAFSKMTVKVSKKFFYKLKFFKLLSEKPYCSGIRNRVFNSQIKKTHEGKSVLTWYSIASSLRL